LFKKWFKYMYEIQLYLSLTLLHLKWRPIVWKNFCWKIFPLHNNLKLLDHIKNTNKNLCRKKSFITKNIRIINIFPKLWYNKLQKMKLLEIYIMHMTCMFTNENKYGNYKACWSITIYLWDHNFLNIHQKVLLYSQYIYK
jgi:hypothetical protein